MIGRQKTGLHALLPDAAQCTITRRLRKRFFLWHFCISIRLKRGTEAAVYYGNMCGKGNENRFALRSVKAGSTRRKSVAEILRSSYRRYARDPLAEIAVESVLGKAGARRGR